MNNQNSRLLFPLAVVSALTVACGLLMPFPRSPSISEATKIIEDQSNGVDSNVVNGERIYYSASNQDNERLTYRGGPEFGGMMMGAFLTCAACHGPEARGGTHVMHMQVMDAPDIRYEALQSEAGDHGQDGHDDNEHGAGAGEYTLDDFRRAVIAGEHPDGKHLSQEMPRWEISDEDLADLFEFLKSLP